MVVSHAASLSVSIRIRQTSPFQQRKVNETISFVLSLLVYNLFAMLMQTKDVYP